MTGWPDSARYAVGEVLWDAGPKAAWAGDKVLAALAPYLAAAEAAGAERARDLARIEVAADMRSQAEGLGGDWMATMQMLANRLLGDQAWEALAAAEKAAKVAGMREAAAKVRVHASAAKRCSDEGDVIHHIRAEYLAKAFALNAAADDIEAAILALAEKEPPHDSR